MKQMIEVKEGDYGNFLFFAGFLVAWFIQYFLFKNQIDHAILTAIAGILLFAVRIKIVGGE